MKRDVATEGEHAVALQRKNEVDRMRTLGIVGGEYPQQISWAIEVPVAEVEQGGDVVIELNNSADGLPLNQASTFGPGSINPPEPSTGPRTLCPARTEAGRIIR